MPSDEYLIQHTRELSDHTKRISRSGLSGMTPLIITCALTGGLHGKSANPNLPESAEEQAREAYDAYNAGASMIHIHRRDPQNHAAMTRRYEDYQEVNAMIRARCPEVIVNNFGDGRRYVFRHQEGEEVSYSATGQQMVSLPALPEVASVDITCNASKLRGAVAFMAHRDLEHMVRRLRELDIKPEFEIFKMSDIKYLDYLEQKGLLDTPYWAQMVFGGTGVPPLVEEILLACQLLPKNGMLSVIGIGAAQTAVITQAILLGHHVRVGMEDNVYYGYRQLAAGNGQLVERVVRLARELGRPIATPAQAREMMGLGGPRSYVCPPGVEEDSASEIMSEIA